MFSGLVLLPVTLISGLLLLVLEGEEDAVRTGARC